MSITTVEHHYIMWAIYCRIRQEGLLCDAERDLLAIAKFLVVIWAQWTYNFLNAYLWTGVYC